MNSYPITMGKKNGFKPFIADTVSKDDMRRENKFTGSSDGDYKMQETFFNSMKRSGS